MKLLIVYLPLVVCYFLPLLYNIFVSTCPQTPSAYVFNNII